MQLLVNTSRFLLLLVLSCSVLMFWKYSDLIQTDFLNIKNVNSKSDVLDVDIKNPSKKQTSAGVQIVNHPIDIAITKQIIINKAKQIAGHTVAPKNNAYGVKSMNSIWTSIATDLELDHRIQTFQVKREITRLVADKNEFNRILKAAAPYIYFIHKQTQERGLPAELALIPFVESQFNPNDRSTKGAIGLWQLMPATARELGVKIKASYDGRRNVIASTKAALLYFRDLGRLFKGDWLLAIAAYNCGQVKVESAVKRAGHRNFWSLSLPRDTQYYVPRLLAVAEIIKNPEKYGIKLPVVSNAPYFTEMKTEKSQSLAQLAKSIGVDIKLLQQLNPDYKQGLVPKSYSLLIPVTQSLTV